MMQDVKTDAREITIQELVELLAPGTRLTLIFTLARGGECRRHRTVVSAETNVIRLATVLPETEPFVEIEFWPGHRIFALEDGFLLAFQGGITRGTRYAWGHV